MSKWIAEFELEDGDKMPEHMDLEYHGVKLDFHCRPIGKTYEDGLNEAWKLARRIVCMPEYGGETVAWLKDVFGDIDVFNIIRDYSVSEAIAKVKEYEEKQKQTNDEIKVGDEIERIKGNNGRKYIVTKIIESDHINIIFDDGGVGYVNPIHYRKTGRHFPQIVEVLKQMQEQEEE